MKISSSAFNNGKSIPEQYTCDGENMNPALMLSDLPKSAKSLALIIDDPDSPTGVWTHWLLWNISPTIKEIGEGKVPRGAVQGETTFGSTHYGGPCPGKGNHRYFFKLYALDTAFDLPAGSEKDKLMEAMKSHILSETEMYGWYERKKQNT
ncbi:MAG: YbhB/YbcL family Raf kinase inhibitor-like protein [Candidatus Yonathbacteria bacterium]|nr:YbhB/YbcL family Raf kinase inhibitor-like protein [Candidatus Yonathbacteria bacterium]